VLSIVVLALYLAGALWLIASARPATTIGGRTVGLSLSAFAVLLHGVLLWQTVALQATAALSSAETASLIALGVAVIALLTCWRLPRFAGASAVLIGLAGLAAVITNRGASGFAVAQQGWELSAHIAASVLAYSLICVGTALAIALALLDRRLRKHQPLGWLSILPPVASLESGMFLALGAGFAALSLALFSGFFFVHDVFGQSLSRKIILSCLAWIILAVLLFGRWRFGWRGRIARNWTIGGFVMLGLAYFGSKLVLETILGRHWG
jgi:ABC-type uncharacterized transport system permease subunit